MWVRLVVCSVLLIAMASAQELPYRQVRRAMLVEVQVNGRPAMLIVDTGADHTVLSPEMVGLNDVDLITAKFNSRQAGLVGEAILKEAEIQTAPSRSFRIPVAVMKLDNVSKIYGMKVDGLIGQDILSLCGNVYIDYRNKTIRLGESTTVR